MTATSVQPTAEAPVAAGTPAGRRWPTGRRADLLAYAVFLGAALYVTVHLWADVQHRVLGYNPTDQAFAEWMYADQAYALTHLRNPFFSHGQNAPLGINLMGNVATQLVSWILSPVTLLFGPAVTFATVITLNLAGTASAWYFVLSRHVVKHRVAAFLGAAFCGFAPGLISASNGHVHIPAQYLVPFLILAVVRLREPGRVLRNGLVLGALVAVQFLVGLEVLFLTAFACGVMVVAYAATSWREARAAAVPFVSALAIAGAVVLVVCAYPLWMLFFGPRHYSGLVAVYSADLTTFFSYPVQSLGGLTAGTSYTPNLAEQAAFFGWPLTLGAVVVGVLMWRSVGARLAAVTGGVCAVLSLGSEIMWKGRATGIPGPYRLLSGLPVFDSLITLRLALVTTAAIGLLVALAADWALERAPEARAAGVPLRAVAALVAVAVLVPLVPRPLPAVNRPFVPHFITSGRWQDYVHEGRTLVPVDPDPWAKLRWGGAGEARFAVPQGFTIVPRNPPHDMTGVFNVPMRPTEERFYDVSMNFAVNVTPELRQQAVVDMRYLKADAVVLNATVGKADEMAAKISALLDRPAERVDDVYVWRVRDI